jgi:hypothetical protein
VQSPAARQRFADSFPPCAHDGNEESCDGGLGSRRSWKQELDANLDANAPSFIDNKALRAVSIHVFPSEVHARRYFLGKNATWFRGFGKEQNRNRCSRTACFWSKKINKLEAPILRKTAISPRT